ncbi:MAG: hypothetical protein SGI73_22535 [Chloroflexota bacterium]|nr:hypothetical protein [Chloroflexota bacterium]
MEGVEVDGAPDEDVLKQAREYFQAGTRIVCYLCGSDESAQVGAARVWAISLSPDGC